MGKLTAVDFSNSSQETYFILYLCSDFNWLYFKEYSTDNTIFGLNRKIIMSSLISNEKLLLFSAQFS